MLELVTLIISSVGTLLLLIVLIGYIVASVEDWLWWREHE